MRIVKSIFHTGLFNFKSGKWCIKMSGFGTKTLINIRGRQGNKSEPVCRRTSVVGLMNVMLLSFLSDSVSDPVVR